MISSLDISWLRSMCQEIEITTEILDEEPCFDGKVYKRKGKTTMRVTLNNGMTLEGTVEQVAAAAKALGQSLGNDGVFYMSESRGLVKISDMDDTHLQNALRKVYREWVLKQPDALKFLTGMNLARALKDGCTDKTFLALYAEFAKRVSLGRYR